MRGVVPLTGKQSPDWIEHATWTRKLYADTSNKVASYRVKLIFSTKQHAIRGREDDIVAAVVVEEVVCVSQQATYF